jgi:hypothetical protein
VTKNSSSNSVSFTKDKSPLEFRNQIVYYTDDQLTNKITIDNSFFISSISFVSEKSFNGKSISKKECKIDGSKNETTLNEYPYKKPNTFYILIK